MLMTACQGSSDVISQYGMNWAVAASKLSVFMECF